MSFQPTASELKEQLRKDDFERKTLIPLNRQQTAFTPDIDLMEIINQQKHERAVSMSWVKEFTMSDKEMDEIGEPVWAFKDLIIQGHLIAIVAQPNGGKTTIFEHVAAKLASKYDVYYVNADISAGDAKRSYSNAKASGWNLLLPDMKAGLSMSDVVEQLEYMNELNERYDNQVWIFDTLKKMVNIIQKSESKRLLQSLRGLSSKGMTIVLLAHTNKRAESDGSMMYEGTGDLRADVDELIYLHPLKNPDGSMTVSTEPDKVRGIFEAITFEIARDRAVSLKDDFVNTKQQAGYKRQLDADQELIGSFFSELKNGSRSQKELTDAASENGGHARKAVIKVLNRYDGDLWLSRKGGEHNKKIYSLPPVDGSFIPRRQVTTDITDTAGLTGTSE
jgi:hypothetical protein